MEMPRASGSARPCGGYDPSNVVVGLGPDGTLALNPEYIREVGVDALAPLKRLMAKVYESHRARYHVE